MAKGKKSGKKKGGGGKKSGKKGKKSGRKSVVEEVPVRDPDMLDPAAMFNLYYIAHNVPHAMEIRGFKWPDGGGKKKKKGKKK